MMNGYAVTQRIVFVILTTLFLAAPSAYAVSHNDGLNSSPLEELQLSLSNISHKVKISNAMAVNTDPAYHQIVPNKCKNSGESELIELSKTSPIEESFVFVPALCIWIESGLDESPISVRPDTGLIEHLKLLYNDIIIYHMHVGWPGTVEAYFPAYSDIVSLVILNAYDFYAGATQIRHRAVTSRGIIEYAFLGTPKTEMIWKKMTRLEMQAYAAQNLAYEFSRDEHIAAYYAQLKNCQLITNSKPENIERCFPLRFSGFLLTFDYPNRSLVSAAQK